MISWRISHTLIWTALAGAIAFACGSPLGNDVSLGTRDDPRVTPFTPADAGGADSGGAPILLCLETECPAPSGTCSSSKYKCDIDFSSDDKNCGRCGNACLNYATIQMETHCRDGACVATCEGAVKDCNGIIDDGCETFIKEDPANCGECGLRCADGIPCLDGQCGCIAPMVLCNGRCVNTTKDGRNCGACDNICGARPEDPPLPPHMGYGCSVSKCGMGCSENWADCDGDVPILGFASNGCETSLVDPENCGACKLACAPGEKCAGDSKGNLLCTCGKGQTDCGLQCADLLSDPNNCGGCGVGCPGATADVHPTHAEPTCRSGECGLACDPGWADCDGDPANGCEADLMRDPNHCGACTHGCDASAGQPCVRGACLTKPCEQGPTQ